MCIAVYELFHTASDVVAINNWRAATQEGRTAEGQRDRMGRWTWFEGSSRYNLACSQVCITRPLRKRMVEYYSLFSSHIHATERPKEAVVGKHSRSFRHTQAKFERHA